MSPTSSMSSHPEKASLTLCSRATVDCRLFLVIWADAKRRKKVIIDYIVCFTSCVRLHYTPLYPLKLKLKLVQT